MVYNGTEIEHLHLNLPLHLGAEADQGNKYKNCTLGLLLNFAPQTFPDPVAIDFKATEGERNLTKCYFQLKVLIFNTEKEKKTCNNC